MREIAYLMDISKSKVSFWVKRYNDSKMLTDKKRNGRTPKLTNEQIEVIKEAIKHQPDDKYRRENNEFAEIEPRNGQNNKWTPKIVLSFIKYNFKVDYSLRFAQKFIKKHKPV